MSDCSSMKDIVATAKKDMERRGWEVIASSDAESTSNWMLCRKLGQSDLVVLPRLKPCESSAIGAVDILDVGNEITALHLSERMTFTSMSVELRSGKCVLHKAMQSDERQFAEPPRSRWHDEKLRSRVIRTARTFLAERNCELVTVNDSDLYDFAMIAGREMTLVSVSSSVAGPEARDWIVEQPQRASEAMRVAELVVGRNRLSKMKSLQISGLLFIFSETGKDTACVRASWNLEEVDSGISRRMIA